MTKKLMIAALALAALTSIATDGAFARGGMGGHSGMHSNFSGGAQAMGGSKMMGGSKAIVARPVGLRHHRHWFYGPYAYNPCWKYTPAGWVNVCLPPK